MFTNFDFRSLSYGYEVDKNLDKNGFKNVTNFGKRLAIIIPITPPGGETCRTTSCGGIKDFHQCVRLYTIQNRSISDKEISEKPCAKLQITC